MSGIGNVFGGVFARVFGSTPSAELPTPAPVEPKAPEAPKPPKKPATPANVANPPTTGRVLRTELREYIERRIERLGLTSVYEKMDPTEIFLAAAHALEGIREKGSNAGTEVEWIQDTVGGVGREAWCMSAMQSCIRYAELKTGKRSPLAASEHCLTVYNEAPAACKTATPTVGTLVIWRHGSSSSGHTGAVQKLDGSKYMWTSEGNTGAPDGEVVREGDGFYYKRRDVKATGSMKVVGFLRPFV